MIVYDTGALVAGERGDRRMWALHEATLRRGALPVVPAGVLAQAWRGGPQANLSRLLQGCDIGPLDEPSAREAGSLCAAAVTPDVIDANVVVLAARLRAGVVTSDPSDIERLAQASGIAVAVHGI